MDHLHLYRRLRHSSLLWAALIAPFLSACAAQPVIQSDEVPAVLVQMTSKAQAELRSAVATMLAVPDVTLANDVLLRDSLLVIEKAHPRDARGRQLSGRDYDRPEQFRLIKTGPQCVVVRLKTGERRALRYGHCIPFPN
jgi:hypothetical protein